MISDELLKEAMAVWHKTPGDPVYKMHAVLEAVDRRMTDPNEMLEILRAPFAVTEYDANRLAILLNSMAKRMARMQAALEFYGDPTGEHVGVE